MLEAIRGVQPWAGLAALRALRMLEAIRGGANMNLDFVDAPSCGGVRQDSRSRSTLIPLAETKKPLPQRNAEEKQ